MTRQLGAEPRQKRPPSTLHQEAFTSLCRTESLLSDALGAVLKPHGLGLTQYNVLRILRGAGPMGLCRNEIRDRLIARMPDVTRLLDRMEDAKLITRARSTEDRRLVSTLLTERGQRLVDALDAPVEAEHKRALRRLSTAQLRTMIEVLSLARGAE